MYHVPIVVRVKKRVKIAHRPQHKKECKKRAAELHDEELFKQPPPKEDCPICFICLPSLKEGYRYKTCCGKMICSGCIFAPVYDDQGNQVDNEKCPFCRVPTPVGKKEMINREKKRAELEDPIAMLNQGHDYFRGTNGYPKDYAKALELFHRSGKLGHTTAYNNIGYAYDSGEGVLKDDKKANHYYELAAMQGNEGARHNLGINEEEAGNFDRALRHYMIAVKGGFSESLDQIQKLYLNGHATKEDYRIALQSYQTYLGEIKSPQRDEAAAYDHEEYRYY